MVGESVDDLVGAGGIVELFNGNYVIASPRWNEDRGAATWANGLTGIIGKITTQNSLIGTKPGDSITYGNGYSGILALENGNYVVSSVLWNNRAGAVILASGATGISGEVNAINSLIGSHEMDRIGSNGIVELSNGNVVIGSQSYNGNQGAVTWINGDTGLVGFMNDQNSLLGSTDLQAFGDWGVVALKNGNYLVCSSNNERGSLLWRNGEIATSGLVNPADALNGSIVGDRIGYPANDGVVTLDNGNYVTVSYSWNNNRGAVTWGNGSIGKNGSVNETNSLVGSDSEDYVGYHGVDVLPDGNYLVKSPTWNDSRGGITWGSGIEGVSGFLDKYNSLVGNRSWNWLGGDVDVMPDGNYISRVLRFNDVSTEITLGSGSRNLVGEISSCNSLIGNGTQFGNDVTVCYNSTLKYLIVGWQLQNRVSIFKQENIDLPLSVCQSVVITNGAEKFPFISESDCKIIASFQPDGNLPVGKMEAKVWVEPSVPVFGSKPFVARHYQITSESSSSNTSGIVTLYFKQSEFNDFNAHAGSILNLPTGPDDATGVANLKISKYPGASIDGSGLPESFSSNEFVINPNDSDVVWNHEMDRWEVSFHVNGLSIFLAHSSIPALPLNLVHFEGKVKENITHLFWETNDEVNTHYFQIERSSDAKKFVSIGKIEANNTLGLSNYSFKDSTSNLLGVGKVYYRLEMRDQDDSYSYSKMIAVVTKSSFELTVSPNPSQSSVVLRLGISKDRLFDITVVNASGSIMYHEKTNANSNDNSVTLDTSSYPAGIYLVGVQDREFRYFGKFVKE